MLFLIEYDREAGKLVTLREFGDSERKLAEDARIDLEVSLNQRAIDHEVVLLQAASRQALEQTHRRYFVALEELARATGT